MTKASPFFLERLQYIYCQKQDLRHECGIIFWILKQTWSSITHWNFWLKCITDKCSAKFGMSWKSIFIGLISGSSIGRITIKRTSWRTTIMIMGNDIFITESTIKNLYIYIYKRKPISKLVVHWALLRSPQSHQISYIIE